MAAVDGGNAVLDRLLGSNADFAGRLAKSASPERMAELLSTAHPRAVVLGCSDSRVPPEVVLGQQIGDLFVIRVAGNIAGSDEVGSIEYAIARWSLPLLLVLGHTECGAVAAVLDPPPGEAPPDLAGSPYLASLLVTVRANASFARVGALGADGAPADRWLLAVEANVRETVSSLVRRSDLIRRRVAAGELLVAGAIYDVRTGCVARLPAQG